MKFSEFRNVAADSITEIMYTVSSTEEYSLDLNPDKPEDRLMLVLNDNYLNGLNDIEVRQVYIGEQGFSVELTGHKETVMNQMFEAGSKVGIKPVSKFYNEM